MEIQQAVAALAALAQGSRLAVFRLLVRHGENGLPAGEIAARLRVAPATLSFHLSQLTHARLVDARRDGRSMIYHLRIDGIRRLMAFLTEDCCQGRPELCFGASGKRHAEECCDAASCRPNRRRKAKASVRK